MASLLPRRIAGILAAALVVAAVMTGTNANFQMSDWSMAHATFYGDSSGVSNDMGGACGYSNLVQTGYGAYTAALSTPLFNKGSGCGGCYEIRCTGASACYSGAPTVKVTATNLCPPNYYEASNNGGWCNEPLIHFDMSMPAFAQIAEEVAGIVPVMYRRIPCQRTGGIRFLFQGNAYWLLVFIENIGGAGDVSAMWVKGTNTDWISMSKNWGISYQAFANLGGQALSFKVTTYTSQETVVCNNVADAYWQTQMTYEAQNCNFY